MNTYNFYYETSGFERTVNGYSGSEVSKAELQFKTSRKAVKKGLPIEEVKTEFTTLSTILHTQANHLDGIEAEGVCGLTFGEAEAAPAATDAAETVAAEEPEAKNDETTAAPTEADASKSASSGWMKFISCFAIILREGLEAILVVGAIIAYCGFCTVRQHNRNAG